MHGLSIYVCDEISFVVYNIFSNSDFKIKKKKMICQIAFGIIQV